MEHRLPSLMPLSYRGRLLRIGPDAELRLEHPALRQIEPEGAKEDLEKYIRLGNQSFYGRAYRLALRQYEQAEKKVLELGLDESHPMRITVRVLLGDALSALFRFPEAETQFVAVSRQNITADSEPITLAELWLKLAKVFMGAGDSYYRAAANDVKSREAEIKSRYDKVLGGGNAPDPSSPLYRNALAAMRNPVRRIVDAIGNQQSDINDINAEIVAIIFDCRARFDQITEELNFLGHSQNYVPILRFKHLQNVARTFAKTAGQANREYLSYVTKVQDETFTLRQLEQAVEVNRSGVTVHRSAEDAARAETLAAHEAVNLARTRADLAEAYSREFAAKGYEVALLDAALGWAQSTSVPHDDQIKLRYDGLSHLGIAERYQPQSQLIHELTWQRARRNYDLQRDRLTNQATELRQAVGVSVAQRNAAMARAKTAKLRRMAAQERLRHSEENLEAVRSRDFGVEFFSEMAGLVRETAAIYLHNAMLIAFMMEKAYNFETGRDLELIRLDYGDLDGAGDLYAADMLLRDIDAFTFDQIVSAETKTQPLMRRISLGQEYPLEFIVFRRSGYMRFSTVLEDYHRLHPGLYDGRIKSVIVRPIGLVGKSGPIGTLRVNGVSQVRARNDNVYDKMHPAETLFLSAFDSRRDRAFTPLLEEELDVFENVGLQTDWELSIRQFNNKFDVGSLVDIEIYLTFYGKHDSVLESRDLAAIPLRDKSDIEFSLLRDFGGDAIYRLSRTERLDFEISQDQLPRQHRAPIIKGLRMVALGKNGVGIPLKIRFWSEHHGSDADSYESDDNHVVVIAKEDTTSGHHDKPLPAQWYLKILAYENPELAAVDDQKGTLNLDDVADLFLVAVYEHENSK